MKFGREAERVRETWLEKKWFSCENLAKKTEKIYIYTGSNYLGMNQGTLPPCLFFKIEPNTVLLISEIYRVFSCMLGKWSAVLFF